MSCFNGNTEHASVMAKQLVFVSMFPTIPANTAKQKIHFIVDFLAFKYSHSLALITTLSATVSHQYTDQHPKMYRYFDRELYQNMGH